MPGQSKWHTSEVFSAIVQSKRSVTSQLTFCS